MKLTMISVWVRGRRQVKFFRLPTTKDGRVYVSREFLCREFRIPDGATYSIG